MPRTASFSAILSLFLLSLTQVTASIGHHAHGQAKPRDHIKKLSGGRRDAVKREIFTAQNVTVMERGVEKRQSYSGMRATFYDIGLGACGQYNGEPDFIVALNSAQYGGGYPGPECFKYITISGGSRNGQAVARIMDECPGCPYGGLDMSRALFQVFASLDEGVATVNWYYNDGSGGGTTTSTTPAYTPPTTSSTPAYTPSTSSTQTPTSSYTPPATTTTTTNTQHTASGSLTSSKQTGTFTFSFTANSTAVTGVRNATSTSSNAYVAQITASVNSTISGNATDTSGTPGGSPDSPTVASLSNLEMLSTLTAQIGGLVVQAAQAGTS